MDRWPHIVYAQWKDTLQTLHLWTQIVGKIRLRLAPFANHSWNSALYVTPRGLTTSAMPYRDGRMLEIRFDFVSHALEIDDCDGARRTFALAPMSVAAFYERVMRELRALGYEIRIDGKPNEVAQATPFAQDTAHASYDAAYVERFRYALLASDRLCNVFRSGFYGKVSPVHFFWGSFDLAFTRFSGRRAPEHPGGFPNMPDRITREAYSREEHSVGFWPGGAGSEAIFYAYAYPEPPDFPRAPVKPAAASWYPALREFVLPYEDVRTSDDPDRAVLEFFSSTYDAAATLSKWDRALLEREPSDSLTV
ncbi:MAG: DUF5996 family protein [Candidatus Tyrphobacter sp.]